MESAESGTGMGPGPVAVPYRSLVETAPMAIAVHVDGRIVYANRCAEAVLGLGPGEAVGLEVLSLVHRESLETVRHRLSELAAGRALSGSTELVVVRPDGGLVRIESVAANIDVAGARGVYVMACDVTERARREAHLSHLATHDGLTGLPNRLLLLDRLDQALARVGRSCAAVLVMFLDLDGFKQVNDDLGHAAGDDLLRQVAGRLRQGARGGDTVARLAGDEFVVCAELDEAGQADALRARVQAALAEPYVLAGVQVSVGASVGAVVLEEPRDSADVLVDADRLMYAAKHSRSR